MDYSKYINRIASNNNSYLFVGKGLFRILDIELPFWMPITD